MSDFTKGMICAASIVAASHGDTVIAKEILQACGKINWRTIDQYDKDKLKEAGIVLKRFA